MAAAIAPEAEVATAEIDMEAAVPVVPEAEPVSSRNALNLALVRPGPASRLAASPCFTEPGCRRDASRRPTASFRILGQV